VLAAILKIVSAANQNPSSPIMGYIEGATIPRLVGKYNGATAVNGTFEKKSSS
jgi:hypothetical protein